MNNDSINLGEELLEELQKKKRKKTSTCEGCQLFEQFGKKCWFYWEDKKFCSQHTSK